MSRAGSNEALASVQSEQMNGLPLRLLRTLMEKIPQDKNRYYKPAEGTQGARHEIPDDPVQSREYLKTLAPFVVHAEFKALPKDSIIACFHTALTAFGIQVEVTELFTIGKKGTIALISALTEPSRNEVTTLMVTAMMGTEAEPNPAEPALMTVSQFMTEMREQSITSQANITRAMELMLASTEVLRKAADKTYATQIPTVNATSDGVMVATQLTEQQTARTSKWYDSHAETCDLLPQTTPAIRRSFPRLLFLKEPAKPGPTNVAGVQLSITQLGSLLDKVYRVGVDVSALGVVAFASWVTKIFERLEDLPPGARPPMNISEAAHLCVLFFRAVPPGTACANEGTRAFAFAAALTLAAFSLFAGGDPGRPLAEAFWLRLSVARRAPPVFSASDEAGWPG